MRNGEKNISLKKIGGKNHMRRKLMFLGFMVLLLSLVFGYSTNALAAVTTTCGQCHYNDMNTVATADDIDIVADFNAPNVIAVDKTVACKKCHYLGYHNTAVTSTPYGWFATVSSPNSTPATIHGVHDGQNAPASNASCARCHTTVDCSTCHATVPHKNHSLTKYAPVTLNTTDSQVISIKQVSCATSNCHTPMPKVVRLRPDGSQLCLNCHQYDKSGHGDVTPVHTSTYLATQPLPFDCTQCHQNTLNNEHASRLDVNGNPYDCNTCHKNTRTDVQAAITNKVTTCDACHIIHGDPNGQHTSTFIDNPPAGLNCLDCHTNDIRVEHTTRTSQTTGQLMTCDTCHNSTRTEVQAAIANKNTKCDACHTNGIHVNVDSSHTYSSTNSTNGYVDDAAIPTDLTQPCSNCHINAINQEHLTRYDVQGNMYNCGTCHKSSRQEVKDAIANKQTNCNQCHTLHGSIDSRHNTSYVVNPDVNCSTCHQGLLNNEHLARTSKTTGQPITCDTCHKSQRVEVLYAIRNHETNCDSCHKTAFHPTLTTLHTSPFAPAQTDLTVNCANCHKDHLPDQHLGNNSKTGLPMNCNTCHESTRPEVRAAITNGTTNCDACHQDSLTNTRTFHVDVTQQHSLVSGGVVTFVDNPQLDCASCHKTSLNEEHIGRTNKTGQAITCNSCHDSTRTDVQTAITTHNKKCDACHIVHTPEATTTGHTVTNSPYVTNPEVSCEKCHGTNPVLNDFHLKNSDGTPRILKSTGQQATCDTCHKSTDINVKEAIATQNKNCDACHTGAKAYHSDRDIVHTSNYVANPALDCSSCHSPSLNIAHDRTNSAGVKMDCRTCHDSTRTDVQNAITSKLTNCDACHTSIHTTDSITVAHNTGFVAVKEVDCNSCHIANLRDEHLNKTDATTGQPLYNCDTCHKAVDTAKVKAAEVSNAIVTKNTNCDACHMTRHDNLNHGANTAFASDTRGYDCSYCHVRTVSDQHVGYTTKAGVTMTCNTCHTSTDAKVQTAINTKVDTCDACHTIPHPSKQVAHTSTYIANPPSNCADCHNNVLDTEHSLKVVLKPGQTSICDICHKAVDTTQVKAADVNAAIAAKNTSCDACHPSAGKHLGVTHGAGTDFVPVTENPNNLDCSQCHTRTVDQQHVNKVTKAGVTMTCNTCHNSTRTDVKNAITNKVDTCNACHSIHKDLATPHTTTYVATPEVNCAQCHKNVISDEHTSRTGSNGQTMTCTTCHSAVDTAKVKAADVNAAIAAKNTNCDACHTSRHSNLTTAHTSTYIANPEVDCSQCHNAVLSTEHTSRNGSNGQVMTCNTCHNAVDTAKVQAADVNAAITAKAVNCDACHKSKHTDVTHGAGTAFAPDTKGYDCSYCHVRSLTDQHVGNTTKAGTNMTCNTCHTSTDVKVKTAISTKTDTCDACHTIHGDKQTVHTSNYVANPDVDCSKCHSNVLYTEHENRLNITGTAVCDTCHSATVRADVKAAITAKNTNCDACHTSRHTTVTHGDNTEFVANATLDCSSCHTRKLDAQHVGKVTKAGVTMDCNTCHTSTNADVQTAISTKNDQCSACHVDAGKHPNVTHGAGTAYVTVTNGYNCADCHNRVLPDEHLSRKDANGNAYTCTTCHNSTRTDVQAAISGHNTNCDACHAIHGDVNVVHATNFVVNNVNNMDCGACHRSSLNLEHASRRDINGNPYNCATCHQSTNATVQAAIATKNTNCDACHTVHGPIDDQHKTRYLASTNVDCSGCHLSTLNNEHTRRISPTTGVKIDCTTCHDSYNITVRTAIVNKNTDCDACHASSTIHPDITTPHTSNYVANPELDCSKCHKNVLSDEHTSRNGSNGQAMTCNTCHSAVDTAKVKATDVTTAIAAKNTQCDACHTSRHTSVTHGDNTAFVANATMDCSSCHTRKVDAQHVGKVTKAGVTMDCNTCHASTRTDVQTAISTKTDTCDACHTIHADITTAHKTTYVANPEVDCAQCHKNVLSDEHTSRNGTNGQPMTCDTCHKSTVTAVVNAIAAKNTQCDACHTSRHTSVTHGDNTAFVANATMDCSSCHTRKVDAQHVGKVTKAGVTMDCNTCHASTRTDVQTAISTKTDTCDACHTIHADITTAHKTTYVANPEVDCAQCHKNVLSDEHTSRNGTNGQPMTCDTCHKSTATAVVNAITAKNTQCDACHATRHTSVTHGANTSFVANASMDCAGCHTRAVDAQHVNKVTKAGVTMTCNTCHTNTRTDVQTAIANKVDTCDACHTVHADIDTAHTTNYTASPAFDCAQCHRSTLNAEHLSRTDVNGNAYTCDTCHNNTRSDVKLAIATKNTDCDACHTLHADIPTVHQTRYVANPTFDCSGCHLSTLNDEHFRRISKTTGQSVKCADCHESTNTTVRAAIAAKNTDCDACHTVHADPTAAHTSNYVANPEVDCSKCHNAVISTEHTTRNGSNGQLMTCDTCHNAVDTAKVLAADVNAAIAAKTVNCDACHKSRHTSVTHGANTAFVANATMDCASCHTRALDAQHVGKATNAGVTMDCNTCHASTRTDVQTAISTKTDTCDACHTIHADITTAHKTTYVANPEVDCAQCHKNVLSDEHTSRNGTNGQPMTCDTCHKSTVTAVVNAIAAKNTQCDACHTSRHTSVTHGANTSYVANASMDCSSCHTRALDAQHVNKVTKAGVTMTCNTCHTNTRTDVQTAIANKVDTCDACHTVHADIDTVHATNYTAAPAFDCAACHRATLNSEHLSRLDANGNAYTCDTCHSSTRSDVKLAIATKNTDCDACHTLHADIPTVHQSRYIANPSFDCSSCHNSVLNDEHFSRVSSTTGRNIMCVDCHESTNPTVRAAIAAKNTDCDACHTIHSNPDHTSTFIANPTLDCANCHNAKLDVEHTSRNDSTGQPMTCNTCHKSTRTDVQTAISTHNKQCDACHVNAGHPNETHGDNTAFVANTTMDCSSCHTRKLDTQHVGKVTKAGVTMDCNTCHASTRTDVQTAISNKVNTCDACHTVHADITTAHTSTYVTNPEVDCSQCHKAVISDEHTSRYGTNGQLMTCDTCHKSTATAVVNAINNKNTQCDACHATRHTSATHGNGTAFMVNPPSNCADCHDRKLDTEHAKSSSTTSTGAAITCNTCHTSTRTDVQTAITSHNTQCTACHSTAGTHPNATHGAGTAYVANPTSNCADCHDRTLDTEHAKPSSVTSTGAAITCTTCHKSTNTAVQNAIAAKNTQCDACHNSTGVGTYHNTTHGVGTAFVANPTSNCADCHNRALDTEHAKPSSVTSTGAAITCTTCHKSTNAAVTNAIATKNTQCDACHNSTGVGTYHNTTHGTGTAFMVNPPSNCADCHNRALDTEHVNRVTKAGVTLTCTSCHQSTRTDVQNAITTKNNQCTACHSTAGQHPNANHNTTTFTTDTTTQNCAKCHKTDVSVEHSSSSDKKSSTGAVMDCNTCHQSTNTVVKNAINTANTACTACHTTGGVTAPHSGVADPHKKTYFQETTSRCMSCHTASGISFALTTNTNVAYHKVKEGTTYYPTITGVTMSDTSTAVDGAGYWVTQSPALTKSSNLSCTGCHDTSDGTATGTTYGKLLRAAYTTNTGRSSTYNNDLCFKCHNAAYYTSNQGTSSSQYANTGFKTSSSNLHITRHGSSGCQACHSAKPHSQQTRKHFIVYTSETSTGLASSAARVTGYTHTTSYSKSSCTTSSGCH